MENAWETHSIAEVYDWFPKHPFVADCKMDLMLLTKNKIQVEMPLQKRMCAQNLVMTGSYHVVLGNAAGVTLAMLHAKYFTPFAEIISFKFRKPSVFGKDKMLSATATLDSIADRRILVRVSVSGENDSDVKAEGLFSYAILDREYNP